MDIKTMEKDFFDLKKNNTIFDINCYIPFYQDDFLDDDIPTPEQILTEGVDKLVLADKYCLVDEIYEANQKLLDRVAANDAFYASPVILPEMNLGGKDFKAYLDTMRINQAAKLLKNTSERITLIAMKCGYDNIRTFNSAFKRITGVTPREYRNGNNQGER